ncbi:hypothetical protein [Bradyrhizobium sp.]|uniref:hypothetical protein n=1 Tax=Bradyrhizobium sp. TaxID=376 RepID=UPI003C732A0B
MSFSDPPYLNPIRLTAGVDGERHNFGAWSIVAACSVSQLKQKRHQERPIFYYWNNINILAAYHIQGRVENIRKLVPLFALVVALAPSLEKRLFCRSPVVSNDFCMKLNMELASRIAQEKQSPVHAVGQSKANRLRGRMIRDYRRQIQRLGVSTTLHRVRNRTTN